MSAAARLEQTRGEGTENGGRKKGGGFPQEMKLAHATSVPSTAATVAIVLQARRVPLALPLALSI